MADDLIARIRARLDEEQVRALTEVESKRRILDLHTPRADGYPCPTCWDGAEDGGPMDFPCPTVRALAGEG